MLKKLAASIVILACLVSTPVFSADQTESGVWYEGFSLNGGRKYMLIVFWLGNDNGKIQICGSIYEKGFSNSLVRRALSNYVISVRNTPIERDVNFFAKVSNEDDLGRVHNCQTTQASWFTGANDAVRARLPKLSY